jgi:4-hydroxysphinganine ceramide fatty acyl 2-hydroxylase
MLHGAHHILPLDPDRLVFPPALALIYITIGYYTVLRLFPLDNWIVFSTFWSFFLIGYVSYDLTHYALHHIDTSAHKGGYFHRLQQYHNLHHFGTQHAGFGVSSKFWDIVFNTQLKSPKND